VQAIQPARLPDRHPLFQVWFNLEPDAGASELRLPGLEVALLDDQIDTPTQLDLSLGAELRGGALVLKWIYNEALFDRATIQQLAEQLVHLLAQVAPDPAAPLAQSDHTRVTDAFAQQVDRAPGHPAIVQGQRRWSYAELSRAA